MTYYSNGADRARFERPRSNFVGELNEAIRDNPVPSLLVGAGLLWLFMGGRNVVLGEASRSTLSSVGRGAQHTGRAAYRGAQTVGAGISTGVGAIAEGTVETGSRLMGVARDATEAMGSLVGQSAETVKDTVSDISGSLWTQGNDNGPEGAVRVSPMHNAGQRLQDALSELFLKQPLLLGAIGFVLGAGIASSMPASETESRLMGETADAVKDRAGELWEETTKRGAAAASKGFQEAKAQGLTPEAAGDAARAFTSKVVGITEKASRDVVDRIKG